MVRTNNENLFNARHAASLVQKWFNDPNLMRVLQLASDIVKDDLLPSRVDGPIRLGAKALGILHKVRTASERDDSSYYGELRREGLMPVYSQAFVDFFFESRLRDAFNATPRQLNKKYDRVDAASGDSRVVFIKSSERDEYEDTFFVPKNFELSDFCNNVWLLYPNGLLLSVTPDRWFTKTVFLDVFPVAEEHLTREMTARVAQLAGLCSTTYAPQGLLFLGPAGTGKTACCQLLANAMRRSLLRVDAAAFPHMSLKEVEFVLKFFAPGVLAIEDFDRADSAGNARMLLFLERARKLSPNTIIVLSANDSTKIDYAALRSERIDWVEMFEMPTAEERAQILGASTLDGIDDKLRTYCGELCHANLNRIAMTARGGGDVERTIRVMFLLQQLSEASKNAEKKDMPPVVGNPK